MPFLLPFIVNTVLYPSVKDDPRIKFRNEGKIVLNSVQTLKNQRYQWESRGGRSLARPQRNTNSIPDRTTSYKELQRNTESKERTQYYTYREVRKVRGGHRLTTHKRTDFHTPFSTRENRPRTEPEFIRNPKIQSPTSTESLGRGTEVPSIRAGRYQTSKTRPCQKDEGSGLILRK